MTVAAIELVRDDAGLRALETEWDALWRRCPGATPFQHPAWLLPWWDAFGTGAPRVAVLRDEDGRLAAILPLYDLAAEGKVLPIGAGLSDYLDALVAPDAPHDAATALLAAALGGCAWPCHLPDLPPGAHLRHARPPPGWREEQREAAPCPVLDPADIPPRQMRKLRMARHRAERAGGCLVHAATEATLAALFAALLRLHEAAWRERGEPGVLADAAVRGFHQRALPWLQRSGLLRLRALHIGGSVAAVNYALQAPGRVFFYLGGFDPARAFESPGTLLLGAMLDEAREDGIAECHFLRGAEPYKYAWGARDRRNALRLLAPA